MVVDRIKMLAKGAITGPVLDMVGDRYAYLPLVGAFLLLASLVPATPRARVATACGVAALCVGFAGVVTPRRTAEWRDERTLFAASLVAHPGNPYALYSLGELDVKAGRFDEAEPLLLRAIETAPNPWRAWTALGFMRLGQGRLDEAEQACLHSLAINGEGSHAYVNLAAVYARRGDWPKTFAAASKASSLRRRSAESRYLEALSLANLGDLVRARARLDVALGMEPSHAGARSLDAQLRARGRAEPAPHSSP